MASAQEKGERHEREAVDIISRVYGSGGTEKVDVHTNNDPFGFVDIIGLSSDYPVLLVQVKTNELRATKRALYLRNAICRVPMDHAIFEVWIREDRNGWEMLRFNSGGFNSYAEFDACRPTDVRDRWAEAFLKGVEP